MMTKEEELQAELGFVYTLYSDLCAAYKRLAKQISEQGTTEVNDMSHMTFKNEKEIM